MNEVLRAYGRALRSHFSRKMILLSLVPLLLSLVLWGGLMWLFLQPLLDGLQMMFAEYGWYDTSNSIFSTLGLGMLKVVVVPLVAILLLLPLMIGTSLLFIGVAAMPAIGRTVERRQFPGMEKKQGGSMLGSVALNLSGMLVFAVLWVLLLPLYAIPPLAVAAHALLWAWLTSRVMSYDALADYASPGERRELMRRRRWPLMAIGLASGLAGALPGLAWVGGAVMAVVLFPFLAMLSVWLYILIFLFTGLWFQFYCMQALADLRAEAAQRK